MKLKAFFEGNKGVIILGLIRAYNIISTVKLHISVTKLSVTSVNIVKIKGKYTVNYRCSLCNLCMYSLVYCTICSSNYIKEVYMGRWRKLTYCARTNLTRTKNETVTTRMHIDISYFYYK